MSWSSKTVTLAGAINHILKSSNTLPSTPSDHAFNHEILEQSSKTKGCLRSLSTFDLHPTWQVIQHHPDPC